MPLPLCVLEGQREGREDRANPEPTWLSFQWENTNRKGASLIPGKLLIAQLAPSGPPGISGINLRVAVALKFKKIAFNNYHIWRLVPTKPEINQGGHLGGRARRQPFLLIMPLGSPFRPFLSSAPFPSCWQLPGYLPLSLFQ